MIIQVPQYYPYTLLVAVLTCFTIQILAFVVTYKARNKYFNKDFMSQFQEEHDTAFSGEQVPDAGFPDTGSGRYSKKLSYKGWYEVNSAQRAHMNSVEILPIFLTLVLISGLN